jgi:type II secretory pathway component PulF
MFFKKNFIDKNWTFDNSKFLKILNDARYALKTWKKPAWLIIKNSKQIVLWWIGGKDIWQFINKLWNFLNSWVDLKTAFSIIVKQIKNPKLKQIIDEIRLNLDHWLSISETLRQYSKYFDPLIISLIEVWEKTWNLPKVILELDQKLLESLELKSKIKWALIYPVILITVTIGMIVFMLTFILPKITESFIKTKVEIPAVTQFLIDVSKFITGHYIILIITLTALIAFFLIFKSTYIWKSINWYISIRLPVFWKMIRQENVILFINSFTLLLWSWVLMIEALEIVSNVLTNIHFKKDVIRIKNEVETWVKLSSAMWLNLNNNKEIIFSNEYFPEELVHMVSVWEETGTIWKSIEKVWINYSKELKRYISNLMALLEPFIIVFVWVLIWFIVVAMMLPFFNLAKVAKKF